MQSSSVAHSHHPPGVPGLPGGPQVGGPQAGVAGDAHPHPTSHLSRHWQERSRPRRCKAPGNQKPHHLRDEFPNKEETERPVWDECCWSVNSLNCFLEIVVSDFSGGSPLPFLVY